MENFKNHVEQRYDANQLAVEFGFSMGNLRRIQIILPTQSFI